MATNSEIEARILEAGMAVAWSRGGTGIGTVWLSKLRRYLIVSEEVPTAAVCSKGVIFNPRFVETLDFPELVFLVGHETLHFALNHLRDAVDLGLAQWHGRDLLTTPGQEHPSRLLGHANDYFINDWLTRLQVGRMPKCGLEMSHLRNRGYTGPVEVQAIWRWLLANTPPQDEQDGGGDGGEGEGGGAMPTAGCTPEGRPGDLAESDEHDARAMVREAAIGKGHLDFADALKPPPARVRWRELLKSVAQRASSEASNRSVRSFARQSRRQFPGGLLVPGVVGTEASLCVIVDASGSVSRPWVAQAAGETLALCKVWPHVKVWFGVHTETHAWGGFLTAGGSVDGIVDALQVTGGTDCRPTYAAALEAARKVPGGRFDVAVHFTDGEISPWPELDAAKLLWVGILGPGSGLYAPPPGARKVYVTQR